MIKYNLKTETTEKAAVFCSGEHLWGTHLPHVFNEGTGVPTHGINTEMGAAYCPNFLPQLMAPAGSTAGSHRKLLDHTGSSCWITRFQLDFLTLSVQRTGVERVVGL